MLAPSPPSLGWASSDFEDKRIFAEVVADDLTQGPGALAVNDPHRRQPIACRVVDVFFQSRYELSGAMPANIDLHRHERRRARVDVDACLRLDFGAADAAQRTQILADLQ